VKFLVDVSEVSTNGFDAKEELIGDLFIMVSFGKV
jgi:hypothetical protein